MFSFVHKRLEVKIILALILIVGCVISIFAFIDIRMTQLDTVRTSEQGLRALAVSIKGNVNSAMKKGHRRDVQRILEDVRIPHLIDRIMIYNEQGTALKCAGTAPAEEDAARSLQIIPPSIVSDVRNGDRTKIYERSGNLYLSYFSPIRNQPECYRCHGERKKLNGILRIDFSLHQMEDLYAARRNRILLLAGVMVAALVAALVILLRIIVHKPVKDLRAAMNRAEQGAIALDLPITGEDELADLKQGFVSMLERINTLHATYLEKEKEIARNKEVMRFRAELQAMFDAMPDGVLLVDSELTIIQSNPRAKTLLPWLDDAAGRLDAMCQIDKKCPHQCITNVIASGSLCDHQCKLLLPDGTVKHLHSICAPIREGGRVAYVVQVIRDISERVRTEYELEQKSSELLAANRLLAKIAITDSLTQIYNRRHFDELLYREIKRYNRRKYSSLSLMMIDIDDFKGLNDRYGHLAGDIVLRDTATLLKDGVRETDTVARYGGEEFAIIMPDTGIKGAAYKAEAIRKAVEAREFPGHDGPMHITISIGVAAYDVGFPHAVVRAADDALYQAKGGGKNRVVVNKKKEASTVSGSPRS